MTFVPLHLAAQEDFLRAARPARSAVRVALDRALSTPPEATIVFAPPTSASGRPILAPAAALSLAVEHQLLRAPGSTKDILSTLNPPLFLRQTTQNGVRRFLSAGLQPGMDSPLFHDTPHPNGGRTWRALDRLWIMPFQGGLDVDYPSANAIYALDFWRQGTERPEVRIRVRFAGGGRADLVPRFFTVRGASMAFVDTAAFADRAVVALDLGTPPVEGMKMWIACFAANPVDSPWRAD